MSKDQSQNSVSDYEEFESVSDSDAREAAALSDADFDFKDTPPTNRVSNKYNNEYFQPLRWGVDSLFLSYQGSLDLPIQQDLERLKKLAQSEISEDQSLAQYKVNHHIFEVKDKGTGMFPYILEDNCFRIQLSRRKAESMPMAYVKISSEYLTHKAIKEIVDDLDDVLYALGQIDSRPKVSRIDLFVDFASSEDMESWGRTAWVTRSEKIHQYSLKGEFTGWSIGMGSVMSARLYLKTLEILTSNKQYLIPLWMQSGWDGELPVWRLEFELKRDILAQFDVQSLDVILDNLHGLWSYATTDWLRLSLPSQDDSNRSRWPVHPLWAYLSSIDFNTSGGELSREFSPQRIPSSERLYQCGFNVISSYMAKEGVFDLKDAMDSFYISLHHYLNNKAMNIGLNFEQYIGEKIAVKAKKFNSILNKAASDEFDMAEVYRRQSDGE